MSITDVNISETKKAIMDAYAALLDAPDGGHITLNDLLQKAHVSRSTFYRNYDNVGDVMSEMEAIIIRDLLTNGSELYTPPQSDSANMPSYANYFQARVLYSHRKWIRAISGPNGDPRFRSRMIQLIKKEHGPLFANLEDSDIFLQFLASGFYDVITYWLRERPDISYIDFFRMLYDMPNLLKQVFHPDPSIHKEFTSDL